MCAFGLWGVFGLNAVAIADPFGHVGLASRPRVGMETVACAEAVEIGVASTVIVLESDF